MYFFGSARAARGPIFCLRAARDPTQFGWGLGEVCTRVLGMIFFDFRALWPK